MFLSIEVSGKDISNDYQFVAFIYSRQQQHLLAYKFITINNIAINLRLVFATMLRALSPEDKLALHNTQNLENKRTWTGCLTFLKIKEATQEQRTTNANKSSIFPEAKPEAKLSFDFDNTQWMIMTVWWDEQLCGGNWMLTSICPKKL